MDNQVVRMVQSLCLNSGSPRALAVKLLLEAGEFVQLQQLKVRPQNYDRTGLSWGADDDSEAYWKDAVVTDLLRKCDLQTDIDREAAAVATFVACEQQNAASNVRLNRFVDESLLMEGPSDVAVYDFISHMRKDIQHTLGALPDHLTPRFSGGATFADTGKLITIPDKMSSTPTVTRGARAVLPYWHETLWSKALVEERPYASDPLTVRGNIFFTVPKDGVTFRGCCKEPSLNVAFQLDVGRLMKLRLRRIGIDLKTGQEEHRLLAREASVSDHLATIDMSNASDTLCRVLPRLVLPRSWFELLDSLRATHTRVGSGKSARWFRLEKFSSMGNGFTFELETLIFSAIARAVVSLRGGDPLVVKCYGDDLIVPSDCYSDVVAGLRMFGFQPNMKKTFGEGPFRESCGGDFWRGVPVRAHYVESLPDEPQHWVSLANGLRRCATVPGDPALSARRWALVRKAWFIAQDSLPKAIKECRGPVELGDIVVHDDPSTWSYTTPPRRSSNPSLDEGFNESWDQTYVRAYVPVPEVLPWHHWFPYVQLASCTLGLPSRGVTPRGGISGYRMQKVPVRGLSSWLPSQSPTRSGGVIA
jgi:hypothetical protein